MDFLKGAAVMFSRCFLMLGIISVSVLPLYAQSDDERFAEGKYAMKNGDCVAARRAFESESNDQRKSTEWLDAAAQATECVGDLNAALTYYEEEAKRIVASAWLSNKIGELRYKISRQADLLAQRAAISGTWKCVGETGDIWLLKNFTTPARTDGQVAQQPGGYCEYWNWHQATLTRVSKACNPSEEKDKLASSDDYLITGSDSLKISSFMRMFAVGDQPAYDSRWVSLCSRIGADEATRISERYKIATAQPMGRLTAFLQKNAVYAGEIQNGGCKLTWKDRKPLTNWKVGKEPRVYKEYEDISRYADVDRVADIKLNTFDSGKGTYRFYQGKTELEDGHDGVLFLFDRQQSAEEARDLLVAANAACRMLH